MDFTEQLQSMYSFSKSDGTGSFSGLSTVPIQAEKYITQCEVMLLAVYFLFCHCRVFKWLVRDSLLSDTQLKLN